VELADDATLVLTILAEIREDVREILEVLTNGEEGSEEEDS
jgi:hypothetical protein